MKQGLLRLLGVSAGLSTISFAVNPALAHAPIEGIGAFYNGMLHPVLVPLHLVLIAGIGLLLGQQTPTPRVFGWYAFVAFFWMGLLLGQATQLAVPQAILLSFALLAGGLVALEHTRPTLVPAVLVAITGAGLGVDSRPDGI